MSWRCTFLYQELCLVLNTQRVFKMTSFLWLWPCSFIVLLSNLAYLTPPFIHLYGWMQETHWSARPPSLPLLSNSNYQTYSSYLSISWQKLLFLCSATRVSYRYHLSLSPLDGVLYISDPESHQIIRVRSTEDYSDPDHNWETAVGSGERCLPGDEAHCGDGALARDAKLAYPKGL